MLFVGNGALLARAVSYSIRAGVAVDLVCCGQGDPSIPKFRVGGVPVMETNDPNTDLLPLLGECSDGVAFSINSKRILQDELLNAGVSFFNIHNGLVQKYRGLVEVCIFAALCKGERRYGVTLHRMLPGQEVDSGPVIEQLEFDIGDNEGFSDVLERSMDACQRIFERNVVRILSNSYTEEKVETTESVYSYRDIPRLCADAGSARLARVSKLGRYGDYFPKFRSMVESAR